MEYKEYLESLNEKEREYAVNFFKRKEYIDYLNETVIQSCNTPITSSVGNCNSKIAVIVNDHNNMKAVIKFMTPMLESINISLWNVYTTSIIKEDSGSKEMWEQMIQHEMMAISPMFTFMFTNDKESFIEEDLTMINKTIRVVYINMDDVNYVLNKDNFKTERYTHVLSGFYKYVLNIIQYRDIEIEE